jgi:hypothetical protein
LWNDSSTADLVAYAKGGDTQAWDALVERFAPLIWSICRKYQLDRADAEDVAQNVWTIFVGRLARHHHPAGMLQKPARHLQDAGWREGAGRYTGGADRIGRS